MNPLREIQFQNTVIPSASEGPRNCSLFTQATFVCAMQLMRDSSTPLRYARNDIAANRAFAHFRW
jgi:hypothetical protein